MADSVTIDRSEGYATGPETTVFIAAFGGESIYLHTGNRAWSEIVGRHPGSGEAVSDAAYEAVEALARDEMRRGNAAKGRELYLAA